MKTTNETLPLCSRCVEPFIRHRLTTTISKLVWTGLVLLACVWLAQAVDIRMVGQPVRVTVSVNSSSSAVIPTAVTVTTNGLTTLDGTGTNWVCAPVILSATCPASPSGLSFTLTDANTNVITSVTPVISTNQGSITTNILVWVNTTNVPSGTYGFSLNASGPGTGILLLSVQSAHIWSGAGGTANPAWTSSVNWVGGNVPVSGAEVVFNDGGGLTSDNTNVNVRISANTTIGSLRHAITNSSTMHHNFLLDPGVTLSITNSDGFNVGYRDRSDTAQTWFLTFAGPQSALVVSNPNASVSWFSYGGASSNYMDQLGAFVANVYQFNVSDYQAYLNWTNLQANNYPNPALPRNMPCGELKFARTNIITCGFAGDTEGWTNPALRSYSFVLGRNPAGAGTTVRRNISLGISNYFALNSICFAGSGISIDQTGGKLLFNTNFTANYGNSNCFAVFRGPNGTDRVAMFVLDDFATPGSGGGSTKSIIDLTGGTVDALVDKLWIARDRTNNGSADYAAGELDTGRGTFDVNDVILGFQGNGNNSGTSENLARGVLRVNNGGLFRVNNLMELGYTTADATNNASGGGLGNASAGFGQIFVTGGATLSAKEIRIGGVTKLTALNNISVSGNGSTLIVSNTIARSDKMLNQLSVGSSSGLTLHLNGTNTGHYAYATNLTVTAGAVLNIGSAANLTIPPSGTNVPIFFFTTGGGLNFTTVNMPSPMRGTVVPGATGNENDLLIITNAPKNLIWRGTANNNWNLTSKNWLDTATGLTTNYFTGDAVTFDDFSGVPTTVNLAVDVIPDSVTVSNGANNPIFILNGTGKILGGSLVKNGSGTLEIDANTSIPVQINQGAFTGTSAGSVGSAVIASGATMDFSGIVGPSGLTCAGTASIRGTATGTLIVQAGGIVTNYGTVNGGFNAQAGALLINATNANLSVVGASTVASNALFINGGNLGSALVASTLEVSGIFKDLGNGGNSIYLSTLIINGSTAANYAGAGTFIPGGDGIGTTIIKSPGVGGNFPGRVQMLTGSTNIFKVNVDGPTNYTILRAAWTDFGPSVGEPTNNGGFLLITNVGSSPLAAGQSFQMFKYEDDSLSIIQFGSTNTYPKMSPVTPGTALAWDLNNLKPGGVVAIRGVATTPTNVIQTISFLIQTNNAGVTNRYVVSQLSWPSNYIGWHVEQQTSTRDIGLRSGSTNWASIFESFGTNSILVTNQVTSNSIGFFRMVYP